jgi:hypothetical protein
MPMAQATAFKRDPLLDTLTGRIWGQVKFSTDRFRSVGGRRPMSWDETPAPYACQKVPRCYSPQR